MAENFWVTFSAIDGIVIGRRSLHSCSMKVPITKKAEVYYNNAPLNIWSYLTMAIVFAILFFADLLV